MQIALIVHALIITAAIQSDPTPPPSASRDARAAIPADKPVVMKLSPVEGLDQTPADAAKWVATHVFGPRTLIEHENGQTFATVPERVIMDDGLRLYVEFKRMVVCEPLAFDQLPQRVKVVSRFSDGSECDGAFLRNPTNERIAYLYTWTVLSLTFWDGHGYLVRTIGEGAPWVCGSGGIDSFVDQNGKVITVPLPPPREPRFEPGHHEPEPMPGTLDARVEYCANAPVIASLTPTFTWPPARATVACHAYVQTIGQVDVCEATDMPITARTASVPQGALKPDRSYDLLVSGSSPLGGLTFVLYRFKTAPKDALAPEPVTYEFEAAHGRSD